MDIKEIALSGLCDGCGRPWLGKMFGRSPVRFCNSCRESERETREMCESDVREDYLALENY